MRGTAGITHFSWQQVNAKLLEAITHPLEHRGLDEEDYFFDHPSQLQKTYKRYCEGELEIGPSIWRGVTLE